VVAGRFNGEFKMHAYDAATWRLPLFRGRLRCRGMGFHIWDATDDFSATDMELLFEDHRLYLHDASGRFGAVPMRITGHRHLRGIRHGNDPPLTGQGGGRNGGLVGVVTVNAWIFAGGKIWSGAPEDHIRMLNLRSTADK